MRKDKMTEGLRNKNFSLPKQKAKGKKHPTFFTPSENDKLQNILKKSVIFSWKYFDRSHRKFNCGGIKIPWVMSLLDTLKGVSNLTIGELIQENGKRHGLRFHEIDWNNTTIEKFNFNDIFFSQIEDKCYQLSISKGNGRIIGFLIDNIFFIVWLDPHHQLYLMDGFGGEKEFDYPINEFEALNMEYEDLKKQHEELIMKHQKLNEEVDEILAATYKNT